MTTRRRRGTELETAILDAGWKQLLEGGYPGFTFEAIAERAETGKAAVYRRWPDKEALLLAVLSHSYLGMPSEITDTGSLRGDVIARLRSANHRLGGSAAAVLSTMLGTYFDGTASAPAELRTRVLGDRAATMETIVERAIARGELEAALPPRVLALPFDLFRHEMVMGLGQVDDSTVDEIVDTVFLPLAHALQPQAQAHE